jgi:hypothetical protein
MCLAREQNRALSVGAKSHAHCVRVLKYADTFSALLYATRSLSELEYKPTTPHSSSLINDIYNNLVTISI